jgi:hypothetical protein
VGLGGRGTSRGWRAEASRAHGGRASGSGRRVGCQATGRRASGIWGCGVEGGSGEAKVGGGVEGGGSGAEVGSGVEGGSAEVGGGVMGGGVEGGGAEVGQPDGAKLNFTTIRVSCRRGYSPYTQHILGIS